MSQNKLDQNILKNQEINKQNSIEKNQQNREIKTAYSQFGDRIGMRSKIVKQQEDESYFDKEVKKLEFFKNDLNIKIKNMEDMITKKRQTIIESKKTKYSITKTEEQTAEQNKMVDPEQLKNKIKGLNLQIDNEQNKLNHAKSKNKELKQQISDLRTEKKIFNDIKTQLEQELNEQESDLTSIATKSEEIFKTINFNRKKLNQKKREHLFEQQQYEKQFHEVYKTLQDKNRDINLKKIKDKDEQIKLKRSEMQQGDSQIDSPQRSPDNNDSTQKSRKELLDSYYQRENGLRSPDRIDSPKKSKKDEAKKIVFNNQDELNRLKSEVKRHQKTYEQLKSDMNCNSMNEIVTKFVEYKDKNQTMFNYVQTLRDESEQLDKQEKKLQAEVLYLKELPQIKEKDVKIQKFNQLKNEIKAVKNKSTIKQAELSDFQQLINNLKISIPQMFDRIGCNSEEYIKEFGENFKSYKDIDESNMLQYLGIIEKRTNDLLQLFNRAQTYQKQQVEKNINKILEDSNISSSNIQNGATKAKLDKLPEDYDQYLLSLGTEFKKSLLEKASEEQMKEFQFLDFAKELFNQKDGKKKQKK